MRDGDKDGLKHFMTSGVKWVLHFLAPIFFTNFNRSTAHKEPCALAHHSLGGASNVENTQGRRKDSSLTRMGQCFSKTEKRTRVGCEGRVPLSRRLFLYSLGFNENH